MNKNFTVNHEDILSFLEDNISKLVKLKAASRDKYKEYDDNFMSYITAVNIDDEYRIGLYAEQTEQSYDWMKNKLMKAIEKDASLALNPIIIEYHKLMTDNSKSDASASHEDSPVPKYTDLFEDMDASGIADLVYCFSPSMSADQMNDIAGMPKDTLLKMLADRVYNHAKEWIDDLPHNDLKVLSALVRTKQTAAPVTFQELLIQQLSLIDKLSYPGKEPEFMLHDDIKDAIAPYVDAAQQKKDKNNEGYLESMLLGILNIVGSIREDETKKLMKQLLPQATRKFMPKDVDQFFDHSMLVRFCRRAYKSQSDGILWSYIRDPSDWYEQIRTEEEPYYPSDIWDVLAHGEYPYIHPYRPGELGFFLMLIHTFNFSKVKAQAILTNAYIKLQNPDYGLEEILTEFFEKCPAKNKKAKEGVTGIIEVFCNGIPKFILKGNTQHLSAAKHQLGLRQKVGRNDPCPCGSGKKYKNCCGKK